MNPEEQNRAARLGRAWDDLVSGNGSAGVNSDLLADIQFVQEVTAVPSPPPDIRATIWQQANGRSLPSAMSAAAVAPSPNGVAHHGLAPGRVTRSISLQAFDWLGMCRILAIGMIAGFAAGFASGLWLRFAMRIAGSLTSERNRGMLTNEDAEVGQLTVAGTLSIAMFAAILGIAGGVLFLAVRHWLPHHPALRAVSYGVLLLAVFGFFVMDENNPDYQLFGPTLLNVGTFSLTYIVFGVLVSTFVERLDARVPRHRLEGANQTRTAVVKGTLLLFGVFAMVAITLGATGSVGITIALVVTALLLTIGLRWLRTRIAWRLDTQSPIFVWASALSMIVPGLFGFYLTVQGIVAILAG